MKISYIPLLLVTETAACAVLAAAILDSLVIRPQQGGGSITTLLPGFVYACATVMKVCLVGGLVSLVAGVAWRVLARGASTSLGAPVFGIASVALAPSTPLVGSLAVLVVQRLPDAGGVMTASQFSQTARAAVFVMLLVLIAGVLAALISLARRERPSVVAMLGLAINVVLAGLFWHLRFYAIGFDQDLWAPR